MKAMKLIKEDYRMSHKELLLEAIDNYDLYSPQIRTILKILVLGSKEDNTVRMTIKNLIELSKVSKQGAYNAVATLENSKILEKIKEKGKRLNFFKLNQLELDRIVDQYQTLKNTKILLRKNLTE